MFARLCCTYVEVTLLNNFVHITVSLVVFVSFASFCPYCIHLSVYHCTTNPWPCLSLLPHSVHTVSNYRFIIALPTHGHVCLFCLILSILSTYRCIIALPTHGHVCLFCLTLSILYPPIGVSLHYQPMAMCVSFASLCPYCIHLSMYHCTTNPWPCSNYNSLAVGTYNIF